MVQRERVLARVDDLLATLDDPKAAYVVRSRLDRVGLMAERLAMQGGLDASRQRAIFALLQRIEDAFAALRRRSEPFAEAWVRKLEATRADIVALRAALASAG